jgi:hypothetical protein
MVDLVPPFVQTGELHGETENHQRCRAVFLGEGAHLKKMFIL